ncbi:MAG: LLM class flavin-dependent oxidoreductase, partial [Actinomycetota bacterium]
MNLGIGLPSVGPVAEREFLLDAARTAERLGFHSVWCTDHVVLPPERKSANPYPRSTVDWAYTAGVRWLDPVATLGVVAGATERILIGTSVLVLPYRNPVVLANEIATLDRLS